MKQVFIFLVLSLFVGCSKTAIKQEEYDNLLAENTALKQKVIDLENRPLEVQNVLDMANGKTSCDKYCNYFGKDILFGYVDDTNLFKVNEELDPNVFGVYYASSSFENTKYVLLLYPSGKYVRISRASSNRLIELDEGNYVAKNNVFQMKEKISTGGGAVWTAYEITEEGIIIDIYPPMSLVTDEPKRILFVRI